MGILVLFGIVLLRLPSMLHKAIADALAPLVEVMKSHNSELSEIKVQLDRIERRVVSCRGEEK